MNKLACTVKISLIILGMGLILFNTKASFSSPDSFDVIYYDLNITVDPSIEQISGVVTIQAISLIDALSQLILDFYDNMTVDEISGNSSGYAHNNNQILIALDRQYNRGDTITVNISYHGRPAAEINFDPLTFDRSRSAVTISSESCPYFARCWWPCKDRPDDKPEKMDIRITVPDNLVAASNGALAEIIDNGDNTRTYHWRVKNPIATYLVSFTASDYQIFEDYFIDEFEDSLHIMGFFYPEHYAAAMIDFDNVNDMIAILSAYYGKYPFFYEKYGVAEYVGYWGGMEYQTLSSLQPYLIRGDHSYDDVFLHELAHQWWGDCVTPKTFHHSWLSEGLATFSEALYYGHLEGEQKYHDYMNIQNNALQHSGILYREDISHPDKVYPSVVYYKGAWVIHMLRRVVGEDNFWVGLAEYRNRYQYGSATTEDFQHAFEDVTGDSLGWFFQQWVYQPGYPHYAYGWCQALIAGGNVINLYIDQIQTNGPLFKKPVEVSWSSVSKDSSFVVMVEDSSHVFQFSPSEPIIDVSIDRQDWILKKTSKFTTPLLEYYSHRIVDSTGNNNGLADPGETVDLILTIINKGLPATSIRARLFSKDPDITILAGNVEAILLGMVYEHLAKDLEFVPISISVSPSASSHLSTFILEFEADDTEYNTWSGVDSFTVKIGTPTILLVDDDNGADYEKFFHQPLSLAKVYIDSWEVKSAGVPNYEDVLSSYQIVLWFTGDDRETSLTTEEQQQLAAFLDNGGKLMITGQNIGVNLAGQGGEQDSLFYANYLRAHFLADTVLPTMIMGVASDPIGNGLFLNIDPKAGGAGNQTSPDVVQPINGGATFLKYIPGMSTAGIRYFDESNGSRMVYLPFGYEGIAGPYSDSAQRFVTRIISWLQGESRIPSPKQSDGLPRQFILEQNYPNPFNPTTKIRFALPKTSQVEICIFNLNGQKIKTLANETITAGVHEISWNGVDDQNQPVASGVYIYRLKAGDNKNSKKLLLIR